MIQEPLEGFRLYKEPVMRVMLDTSFRIFPTEKFFVEFSVNAEGEVTLGICVHHRLVVPPWDGTQRPLRIRHTL